MIEAIGLWLILLFCLIGGGFSAYLLGLFLLRFAWILIDKGDVAS